MQTAGRIKEFIREEILFEDPSQELTDETPLLSGVLDSLALLQLVAFLEEEFTVDIDDVDMVAGNFRTVADIVAFVDGKLDAKV